MTDFICSIKSPQSTGKLSQKKYSKAIFPAPRVLTYQRREIALLVG